MSEYRLFSAMFIKILLTVVLFGSVHSDRTDFAYNGFTNADLILGDLATVTHNGLLRLTNYTDTQKGRAFYKAPLHFKNSSTSNSTLSFSTTFISAIVPENPNFHGHGLVFVISPSFQFPGSFPAQFFGVFNSSNSGDPTNHIFAVEHDTGKDSGYRDVDANHIGIDINGLVSISSAPAAYFADGLWNNFSLSSGSPVQTWIEYNGVDMLLTVTVAPVKVPKPQRPLLSAAVDLASVFLDPMYVGFSSATSQLVDCHYILGWSYKMNGQAQALDLSSLPALPRITPKPKTKVLTIGLPIITGFLTLAAVSAAMFIVRRKIKYSEVVEDWEREYGPHRFRYKDLFTATKGFREKELLGIGGFGRVYRGILPSSKIEVAVKKVSHDSKQGMKEFVAEIVSLGRMRHRNLVQLLGYCRRKGELLLVYDYLPNGSLDKYLFDDKSTLNWNQRFNILKGVASGLLYLHEEWEQIVLHRDVKASNVLLDRNLNGKLGDFGLARLYDHGAGPRTTHIVGTFGYMAPELIQTRKVTTSSDVFAFGVFMLEVAAGKRPVHASTVSGEELVLTEWVFRCWKRGSILESSDPKLGGDYIKDEMEMVLKLGLLCSHPVAEARPRMREVLQILDGDAPSTELVSWNILERSEHYESLTSCYNFSMDFGFSQTTSVVESLLSGGR
ncbi:L-type lectin-domain containing receptor kinase SIT2-like [Aristolochia californica]|uniref:L-type lectin-domain containing receptor kinase SIT2-like n=1 Tax=Aristolochia californica TaxID=171875 RepID=UPI0035E2752F